MCLKKSAITVDLNQRELYRFEGQSIAGLSSISLYVCQAWDDVLMKRAAFLLGEYCSTSNTDRFRFCPMIDL
jgi:hypothetical protein